MGQNPRLQILDLKGASFKRLKRLAISDKINITGGQFNQETKIEKIQVSENPTPKEMTLADVLTQQMNFHGVYMISAR